MLHRPQIPGAQRFLFSWLGLGLLLGLTGCADNAKPSAGRGGGAAPVVAGKVERRVVPLTLDAIGAVEPSRTATVRSQVTGTLIKIHFTEGQVVKQGDVLFEIDSRPFQNSLRSAEADLQRIKVQLGTAQAQVDRYRTLNEGALVSQEQFQSIADSARALQSQQLASESAAANARLQLDYCLIRAPLDGRTGNVTVHEGDLIRGNDSAGQLVTVHQISPINVTFGVPQQYFGSLVQYRSQGALKIKVTPPGPDDRPEEGELTFMDNNVDASTGTLKLKGTFPNPKQRLWPGQFATVTLTLAAPEVLTVASSALQTSQAGQHVFVIKEDKTAELRPVTVERLAGPLAVIAKGVAEGETVVTDGQLRVIPGRPVEIKTADASGGVKSGKGPKTGEKAKGKAPEPAAPAASPANPAVTPTMEKKAP
jgi:multidrug efflux system membrane fusion protein